MQTNQKSLKELLTELFDGTLEQSSQNQDRFDEGGEHVVIITTSIVNDLMHSQKYTFKRLTEIHPDYQGIMFEHVDCYGGEDMGATYWSVWKFTKGEEEIMVKFDGHYQSHYGTDFLEWNFVEPVQVMVTQYQNI